MNYVDYGPQNSRGFRALKVWLSFQHLGAHGHRQLIREDIQLAQYAYKKLSQSDRFEMFSGSLSITAFRYIPSETGAQLGEPEVEAYLNKLNQAILNRIEKSGKYFISKAIINGQFALRLCIVNFRTTSADIDLFPVFIKKLGEEVQKEMPMMNFAEK